MLSHVNAQIKVNELFGMKHFLCFCHGLATCEATCTYDLIKTKYVYV